METTIMLRRVMAWILLAGFILLLLNIVVFHILLIPSIAVYVMIAIWFIFTNKPLPSRRNKANAEVEGQSKEDIEE